MMVTAENMDNNLKISSSKIYDWIVDTLYAVVHISGNHQNANGMSYF